MIRVVRLNKLLNCKIVSGQIGKLLYPSLRSFSTNSPDSIGSEISDVHFRAVGRPHPLIGKKSIPGVTLGDHSGFLSF